MRDRKQERARRRELCERLRLQAEILCDSYNQEGKSKVILGRMMLIIMEITRGKTLTNAKRQALADHFTDCALSQEGSVVELGGGADRDVISISGNYNINDLSKRISWSEERTGETIDA